MSSSRFEAAWQGLRDYTSHSVERIGKEQREYEALPGYREARARAKSSEEVRVRLAPLASQIASIHEKHAEARNESLAASERLTSVFAELDADDVRRMFDEANTDEQIPLAFPIVCRFLARSKNAEAVVPLIERLQHPVAMRPEPEFNSSLKRLLYIVGKNTICRSTYRGYDEIYRRSDRIHTLRLLGDLQDRRAEESIRPFLHDADAEVRKVTQEALWSLSA